MVTDRQQKFIVRIGLLASSTDITEAERINLKRATKEDLYQAKQWRDRATEPPPVINTLCLGLKALKEERLQGSLSPAVDRLYTDLVEAYGEPVNHFYLLGPSTFRGISRWFFIGGVGAFTFILLLLSTAYLSNIIESIGKTATIFLYAVIAIIALLIMIISGNSDK
ncbi:hypothetical protein [Lactovum odontotermitis]